MKPFTLTIRGTGFFEPGSLFLSHASLSSLCETFASRPRENISQSARAMSKVFYNVIMSAINENEIIIDEELILPDDDDDSGEKYEEVF